MTGKSPQEATGRGGQPPHPRSIFSKMKGAK
jgi:hypothetical protein